MLRNHMKNNTTGPPKTLPESAVGAHERGPDGGLTAPPPADLRAWRKRVREALIARRAALPRATLLAHRDQIDLNLERGFPNLARGVVAFCWPYKGESAARFPARRLREEPRVVFSLVRPAERD